MSKVRNLNPYDMEERIHQLEENGGVSADEAKRSDIATEFSTETSYTAGNYVYHNGVLYIFNVDHAAGEWDATEVSPANVTDEVTSNKAAIDTLDAALSASPTLAQKNTDYVGENSLSVLKIGHMVVVAGRFQVSTQKPATQAYVLFENLPLPFNGAVIPLACTANVALIINNGYLTSNDAIATGYYNVMAAYTEATT